MSSGQRKGEEGRVGVLGSPGGPGLGTVDVGEGTFSIVDLGLLERLGGIFGTVASGTSAWPWAGSD